MMNRKTLLFKSNLDKLKAFIDNNGSFEEELLLQWISDCILLFSELKINDEIIKGFIKTFEFQGIPRNIGRLSKIGPFIYNEASSNYILDDGNFGLLFFDHKPSKKIFYINVAFSAAEASIEKIQEEERIVPKYLINSLAEKEEYSQLTSSLALIERGYQDKNSDGIVKNSMVLLSSILNLDEELRQKKDLGPQLSCLIDNEKARNKFGVDADIIRTLNNARQIRNYKSVHKDLPLKYNIPLITAIGIASIVILFLEITMAKGEIIL